MAGPPDARKVEEARRRYAAEQRDQYLAQISHRGVVPPSETASDISSTDAVCGSIEYQNTNVFERDISNHFIFSSSPSAAAGGGVSLAETANTIVLLENISVGERDVIQDHHTDSKDAKSSSDASTISTTNASFGDDGPIDVSERPLLAQTLQQVMPTSTESSAEENGGAVPHGDDDGAQRDIETFDASPEETEQDATSRWVQQTVERLFLVPKSAYIKHTRTFQVSLDWAMNIIGVDQFHHDNLGPRKVLCIESKLRVSGLDFGMKSEMLAWLTNSNAPDNRLFDADVFLWVDHTA